MPTPLDRALNSRNAFLGFAGVVTAAAVWSIWGGDIFPQSQDPMGDPSTWEVSELRAWLVRRQMHPDPKATREELIERVKLYVKTKQ